MSGNYPTGGQGPYGPNGPQQGQPSGQGFGQPSPGQPSYGQPGQPGQGGWNQPPQQPGPYQPPPGQYGPPPNQPPNEPPNQGGFPVYGGGQPPYGQPPKKPGSKLPLIIGAGALVLVIIAVVTGIALTRGGPTSGPGPNDPTDKQTQAANLSASAVVEAYLTALADGKSADALALVDDVPADKTFLTDEMLAASNKLAPITDINVPAVTDKYVYRVSASYKMGDQAVNEDFSVTEDGGSYKLNRGLLAVDLSYTRDKTLPMLINGTELKTDKISLFPGTYAFTTGNKWVSYGSDATITATSPDDYLKTSDLDPALTAAGEKEVIAKGKAALKACLAKKESNPKGCPNHVRIQSGQKVTNSSIRWSLREDPWRNLKLRLDYDDPSTVRTSFYPSFKVAARGTINGRAATLSNNYVSSVTSYLSADLTQATIKVTFTD